MQGGLESTLRKVVKFLEGNDFDYAIVGGIALSHWGVVRATFDIDIKLLTPNFDYAATRAQLQRAFPHNARPELPANSLIVAVTVDDIIVDFLLSLPGYEELIIERAVKHDFGEWSSLICSAEDLIIQKVVAGREKDWLDVESLLIEQLEQLDTDYIEEWLTQFVEALDAPELLQRYHQLLHHAQTLHG